MDVRIGRRAVRVALVACTLAVAGCATLATRPLPPKVQVDGVQTITVGSNGEMRFRVRLNVSNPNAYDVAVRTIEADIRVEDQLIASANLADPVVLKASGDTKVDVDARPDFNALSRGFESMLRRFAVKYELSGHAIVDGRGSGDMRLPFAKRGDLPLSDFLGRLR